ncbi:MAG: [protein-PII] uridylyltransferase [Pseudomonadota bacterium]
MDPSSTLPDPAHFEASLRAGAEPLALFRDTLKQADAALEYRFRNNEPVTSLVVHRARLIDQLLRQAWQLHASDADRQVALVAVGGYGRGELHPHSDIDIMLLAEEQRLEAHAPALERFLLFLWDLGLEVGHSVRSVRDCVEQGRADITVATNLMEARLLSGPHELFAQMREQTDQHHIWPGREFFRAKWQEQIERHHKYHDTAFNLEPNIKEGPGGLRDIQMIGWVAKRHFGADTLSDLVEHGFLTSEEYHTLAQGQSFLWRVRYGLHTLAGRREDRLLFDHQRTLAKLFGFHDDGKRLAVEQFMKSYYRTVMELERLNEMLLQYFQEEILYKRENDTPRPINRRFQSRRGFIEVAHRDTFKHHPFAMLELFLILAQQPALKGVRAGTIRQLRAHSHLIDETFRNDLRCRSLFMELLRQPQGITHELRRMNRYGILAAYIPAFGNVVGQMQHDLFHVYTVDEHTLNVVRNLRRYTVPEYHHEFPLCSRIIQQLAKPELLYLAGLFHDIAKGRGGDHSQLGAEDAETFCRHHHLSERDTNLVAWLVRNHLLMSTTAQRKDIADPEEINAFAQKVGKQDYLDYLYLLTVSDIRATSPSVWNSWKDALLAELYHSTHKALRRGLSNPVLEAEVIAEHQAEARKLLSLHRVPPAQIEQFWARLDELYFLRYSGSEIAWHTKAVVEHGESSEPLVLIRQQTERGGTEIFIYTPIRDFQFTTTTTLLDQIGLNIVDARIIPSHDHYTLDTYMVLEEDGEPIRGKFRLQEIEQMLRHLLTHPEETPEKVHRQMGRQLKHFNIKTRVLFHEDPHNEHTVVEVITSDRPGLLSRIARALAACKVRLLNAKIATFGEKVEDIFFITDRECRPLERDEQRQCLVEEITKALEV